MNDRELLELAAKAVGIDISELNPKVSFHGSYLNFDRREWDPFRYASDSEFIVVKLGLTVDCYGFSTKVIYCINEKTLECKVIEEQHNADAISATRRAIVRAAAEIGKGMK